MKKIEANFHQNIPLPMPVDAQIYASNYSLISFINAYYQVRDSLSFNPSKVLIIGVGVGLEPILLKSKFNIDVVTLDIDPDFNPDFVGSVHDMKMFEDNSFDVCIASHVLEHLPFSLFRIALSEISRIAKHAVIYLPYGGKHFELKLSLSRRRYEYSLQINIPPFKKISGEKRELQSNAHYWECGYRNYGIKKIRGIFAEFFDVVKEYHNCDWKYSYNFLLTSKHNHCNQSKV